MSKKMGPSAKNPLQKRKSGSGEFNFSGQDSGKPSSTPAKEVASNQELAGRIQYGSVPVDRPRPVRVFQSCDPKIHTDASFGTVPGTDDRVDGTPRPSRQSWPGPY